MRLDDRMDRLLPGILALIVGGVAAIALFVPFSFRRRGGLTWARTLAWLALLIYVLALWAYTLLPLPDGPYRCVGVELDPLAAFVAILEPRFLALGLQNPALEQVVLNIALFVPLGALLRGLAGRGVVVATLVGLGGSLLIETTQVTGVWGVFPCAYRLFDTGDLVANTLGATIGSLIALPLFARWRPDGRVLPPPRRVTFWHRFLGMVCDLAVVVGVLVTTTAVLGLARVEYDLPAWVDATWPGSVAAFLIHAVVILGTGSSIGEHVVLLRGIETRHPRLLWRLVRLVAGIGGYVLLTLVPPPAAAVFVAVSLVVLIANRDRRGLAHLASGMTVAPARTPEKPIELG